MRIGLQVLCYCGRGSLVMSLHGKYNVGNKKNKKQWMIFAVVFFLLTFFLVFCPTYARYVSEWNGRLGAEIAQWKIKINGVDLSGGSADSVTIEMIPDGGFVAGQKIKAGQTGYFDVVIDPTDTEVSFSYAVAVDAENSNLPNGMKIDGYAVNGEDRSSMTVGVSANGDIMLPSNGIFSSADRVKVRFFWTWEDVDFNEYADYEIVVTATVRQYCGEIINPENTEGARAL